jgi:hypothetical protein
MHGNSPKAPPSTAGTITLDVTFVAHQKRNNTLTLHVAILPWWSHRRHVDTFFQTYRHQNLPIGQRWIVLILEYVEDHLRSDTALGGDIWSERWSTKLLQDLLQISSTHKIALPDLKASLNWLWRLTLLLHTASSTCIIQCSKSRTDV